MLTVVGTVAFDTLAHVKPTLPAPEHTGGITRLSTDTPGGTAGNVALALARLGGTCRLLGAVGQDFLGSDYARTLQSAGIDTTGLFMGKLPTARAYVFYDDANAQVTYFYDGASRELVASPGMIPGGRAHFAAGEILCYPALMEEADWVSFDPGQELFHRDFAEIETCLPHVDVLFVNKHELKVFESREWSLRRLLDAGVEAVVETRSSEGTLVHTPAGRFAAPAVPVQAIDPTGAGDAHRAGFLYALDRGADLGHAARVANVVGSFVVEHVGAQGGLPTFAQVAKRFTDTYGEAPF